MIQQYIQFISCNSKPEFIASIDYEDYRLYKFVLFNFTYLAFSVVFFPESPVLSLPTHIKTTEFNFVLTECFYLEADCGGNVYLLVLFRLKSINQS